MKTHSCSRWLHRAGAALLTLAAGALCPPAAHAAPTIVPQRLHVFGSAQGAEPYGGLCSDDAGNFYGVALSGGTSGNGVVYKISSTGVFAVDRGFGPATGYAVSGDPSSGIVNATGAHPSGDLVSDGKGQFYGTASGGGANGTGTIFHCGNGSFSVVHHFDALSAAKTNADGADPEKGVFVDSDGTIWGVAYAGGVNGLGTVFSISPAGVFTTRYNFDGTHGSHPQCALVKGPDGSFYGTTTEGGANNFGTIFALSPLGIYTVIHSFAGSEGYVPVGGIVFDAAHNLYGTTTQGGPNNGGIVFKITAANNKLSVLSTFPDAYNTPRGELLLAPDGNLYGTTTKSTTPGSAGNVFKLTPTGVLTNLGLLPGDSGDGPYCRLFRDGTGAIYGTLPHGGSVGLGEVFVIPAGGAVTPLHVFVGQSTAVASPELTLASDGNLYGVTQQGGDNGNGTVFKLAADGTYTLLHSFSAIPASTPDNSDGAEPSGRLIQGGDGNLYGTTLYGGSSGTGTLFRVTPGGVLTTVVNFGGALGANPLNGLLLGQNGHFYGTTNTGGDADNGTVFEADATTGVVTVLHSFSAPGAANTDGSNPLGALIQTRDGTIYGTTAAGGATDNGTVFRVANKGFSTLATFHGASVDGQFPVGALALGPDGNLYGTTYAGGQGLGAVFRVTPAGQLTQIASFNGGNGARPGGGLVTNGDGTFYGVVSDGGDGGGGGLYQVTPAGVITDLLTFNTLGDGLPTSAPALAADGFYFATSTLGTAYHVLVSPAIFSAASATAVQGRSFSFQAEGSFAPSGYQASGLPAGLSLNPKTGLISGTPTTVGTYQVTIQATNATGTGTGTLTLMVVAQPVPVITSAASSNAQVGTLFNYQITATNDPTSFDASGLPAGLSVAKDSGLISGAPTQAGTFKVTLSAANAGGTGTATFTLTVAPQVAPTPAPVITSAASADGTAGESFSFQVTASNSPTGYAATGLPAGLGIDAKSGLISGVPTTAGTYSVSLAASNFQGTGTEVLTLTIADGLPVVSLSPGVEQVVVNSGDVASFVVTLSRPLPANLIVQYVIKGTAVNGQDYVFKPGKVKIKAGRTKKNIRIIPTGDLGGAAGKSVKLKLLPGEGYTVGDAGPLKVKILAAP